MIVVRYATLVALVLWLGALIGARFGDLARRGEPFGYVYGAAILVGLLVMKFVGPPPHGFVARVAVVALMLALAGAASMGSADTRALLTSVNVALGFVLLMWYVRE
jgi:hypothetical protein